MPLAALLMAHGNTEPLFGADWRFTPQKKVVKSVSAAGRKRGKVDKAAMNQFKSGKWENLFSFQV